MKLTKHLLSDYDVALVGPEAEIERYRRDVGMDVLRMRAAITEAVKLLEASFVRGLDDTEESALVSRAYDALRTAQPKGAGE